MQRTVLMFAVSALAAMPAWAQPATTMGPDRGAPQVAAQAKVESERPIADADDPINRQAIADTVEALIVRLTLDGREARIDSAVPARVPKGVIQKRQEDGDRVTVVALSGGTEIGRASVPDQVINIEEGRGIVRQERRQISIAVPLSRAPDRLQVTAPATRLEQALDPAPLLADWCQGDRPNPWCPRRQR